MKILFTFLLFLIFINCCQFRQEISSGVDTKNMLSASSGVYTRTDQAKIKFPFLIKKDTLHAQIKITKDKNFNYLLLFNADKWGSSFPCQDGQPMLIQEALDEFGNWRPIEFWLNSSCGMSYKNCVIKSNHYAYYKIRKYKGDFLTKLRVKYKFYDEIRYSPTFNGKINKEQFEQPVNIRKDQFLN